MRPGDASSHSGKAIAGAGFAVDMQTVASNVWAVPFDDSEWNERWQRLVEKSGWSFERSVERGVAMASLLGRMGRAACDIVETIVCEMSVPVDRKTVKPLVSGDDGSSGKQRSMVYFYDGLFVQLAVDTPETT